jgi:uncharacterized membrane protein YccC
MTLTHPYCGCNSIDCWPDRRLSYGTLNVNYALFSVSITGYIVFLLSLADVPGPVIAHRRALCTAVGGSIALIVRLIVISRRLSLWKRAAASVHQRV